MDEVWRRAVCVVRERLPCVALHNPPETQGVMSRESSQDQRQGGEPSNARPSPGQHISHLFLSWSLWLAETRSVEITVEHLMFEKQQQVSRKPYSS